VMDFGLSKSFSVMSKSASAVTIMLVLIYVYIIPEVIVDSCEPMSL